MQQLTLRGGLDSSGSFAELNAKLLTINLQIGEATISATISRDHRPTTVTNSCMCRAAKVMELAGMLEEGERQRTARAAADRQRNARALALRAVRPQSATASFKTTTRDQVREEHGEERSNEGVQGGRASFCHVSEGGVTESYFPSLPDRPPSDSLTIVPPQAQMASIREGSAGSSGPLGPGMYEASRYHMYAQRHVASPSLRPPSGSRGGGGGGGSEMAATGRGEAAGGVQEEGAFIAGCPVGMLFGVLAIHSSNDWLPFCPPMLCPNLSICPPPLRIRQ